MITVDIKIGDKLTPALKNMRKELAKYPQAAEDKFVSLTPVRSGNARSHTHLVNNKTIQANYPYAQRLDEGWSKQAPKGMVEPFSRWARAQAKRIFGK